MPPTILLDQRYAWRHVNVPIDENVPIDDGSDSDSSVAVKKTRLAKPGLVLSTNRTFSKNRNDAFCSSSSRSSRTRPLHEEKTNQSIAEELGKMSLKEQTNMLHVMTYCKAERMQLFQELNQLSMEEREMVLHDIHGICENVPESERLIDQALEEMDQRIRDYTDTSLDLCAYSLAESQSGSYVRDRKRRLLFLRAENMNAARAADRMLDFFEQKLQLFGPEKLCSDITLGDLTPDDMEFLTQGCFQLLPTRDRAGRAVFVHLPVFLKNCRTHDNMLRTIYYMLMSALEDEETQKKGVVFVFSRFGPGRPVPDPELTQKSLDLFGSLPICIRGWHYCTQDKLFSLLFPLVARRFEKQARVRLRVHHGSYIECAYKLMTFGIPVGEFPLTDDLRDVKRQKHQKWMTTRRNLELKRKTHHNNSKNTNSSSSSSSSKNTTSQQHQEQAAAAAFGTLLPSQSDILFGRGKPVQEHPGNISLGVLVESLVDQYNACKGKKQKMDLTQGVVIDIKKRGGRFIKQVDGVWVEVDDETARSKVSHTFRNKKMELLQQSGGTKRSRGV